MAVNDKAQDTHDCPSLSGSHPQGQSQPCAVLFGSSALHRTLPFTTLCSLPVGVVPQWGDRFLKWFQFKTYLPSLIISPELDFILKGFIYLFFQKRWLKNITYVLNVNTLSSLSSTMNISPKNQNWLLGNDFRVIWSASEIWVCLL